METDVARDVTEDFIKIANYIKKAFQYMLDIAQNHNHQVQAGQSNNQHNPFQESFVPIGSQMKNNTPDYLIIIDGNKFDFKGDINGFMQAMNFIHDTAGVSLPPMNPILQNIYNRAVAPVTNIKINTSTPEATWNKFNGNIVKDVDVKAVSNDTLEFEDRAVDIDLGDDDMADDFADEFEMD